MAEPTPSQVKDRVVALCATIDNITTAVDSWPNDSNPFAAAELAAIVVQPIFSPARSDDIDVNSFTLSYDFTIILLAARYAQDYKMTDQTAWEAIEPFRLSVPKFFKGVPQLQLNDNGLVRSSGLPQEVSISPIAFDRALYAAITYRLPVTTIHSI